MAQKNLALQHASHQWVLCLDADEWLRSTAATTIRAALATRPPDVAGYTLKRHTYYLGGWVNHSGWWPEYKIRLFDRQRGQWCGDALHEGIRVTGRVDHLEVEIGHQSYKDMAHHFSKLNTYTTIMARVPARFVNEVLWPEFQELNQTLATFLNEMTDRVISQGIDSDTTEVDEAPGQIPLNTHVGAGFDQA